MGNRHIHNTYTNVFINFSNHPSSNWDDEQLQQAQMLAHGNIVDIPFPCVDSAGDEEYIKELALNYVKKICAYHPDAVMCQGEFGLSYLVVKLLKEQNVHVVYSCSKRIVNEENTKDGIIKTSKFKFVRFREY